MPVEVNLQAAGQPGRYPHIAQTQFFVDEVEVVL